MSEKQNQDQPAAPLTEAQREFARVLGRLIARHLHAEAQQRKESPTEPSKDS